MKLPVILPAAFAVSLAACDRPEPSSASSSEQAAAATAPGPGVAAPVLKSGEQVYKEVCLACHGGGVAGAPKAGEPGGWDALLKEGQAAVTAHGWVGIRGMPPKGGRPDLSLEEFARATAYMARSAGGNWQDPDGAMLEAIREEEVKRIEQLKARS